MGIESDRLVFDYLSKVGDLAQTTLPAADRMRLVAQLRNDIDRARDRSSADSPAAVRRILGRLGSPGEIIEAASGTVAPAAHRPPAADQAPTAHQAAATPPADPGARPEPPVSFAKAPPAAAPGVPGRAAPGGGTPPPSVNDILAAAAAAGPAAGPATEWWRTSADGTGRPGEGVPVGEPPAAGWAGGLIMSEFQPPPPTLEELQAQALAMVMEQAKEQLAAAGQPPAEVAAPVKRRPRIPRIRLRPLPPPVAAPVEAAPVRRRAIPTGPTEVLAAIALVAGAVLGNVILMAAGWVLAYTSRGISRRQAQFAALGLPGITLVGAIIWFWGRATGHWGPRMAGAQIGTAFTGDLPGVARVAAVVSALYLLWRGVVRRG
ncbi:hypothetical protein POF50_009615 [Streptomyces sp. SL13]|uniref:DUF2157 domain-containing protein n=1 Tax=Streptantibioticus silvisoli TaxID=2705255 RepID=A0AA90H248_9ACTN|nr:hypothetical protein [Streptantibioticus silvisoli]MDI5967491.1 hypothetical protein [Streptantibioticus silvisoli]MDI5969593.1 hypothetical protein [Streptantibioticus silvisoli]